MLLYLVVAVALIVSIILFISVAIWTKGWLTLSSQHCEALMNDVCVCVKDC